MSDITPTIEPKETGVRILFSVLFSLIVVILVGILGVVTVFALLYALVTQRVPTDPVRRFANRTISYLYRSLRYLTYNDTEVPFPFSDFPGELESCAPFPHHPRETSTTSCERHLSQSDFHPQDNKGSQTSTMVDSEMQETTTKP
jgi:hypothetical protein